MSRCGAWTEASDMPYQAEPHCAAGSIPNDAKVCEAGFVVRLRNARQPNSDSLQHYWKPLICSAANWIGSHGSTAPFIRRVSMQIAGNPLHATQRRPLLREAFGGSLSGGIPVTRYF